MISKRGLLIAILPLNRKTAKLLIGQTSGRILNVQVRTVCSELKFVLMHIRCRAE